ncbi:hypothetical protein BGZ70_003904, partial [Mortierella alpina]
RVARSIFDQKYEAESCPHPPLFVLLPENPLQWSFDNILHNKMRLHFLCDCCKHERTCSTTQDTLTGFAAKKNLHVNDDRGFELRMDRFEDQLLLIKFGHYVLHLLRILQYGVSLDDVFIAAAFDQLVPLPISYNGLVMDPELHFKQKLNVDRSVAFMEALLGDEYEDEAAEVVRRVDMNDFRLLNSIIKRPPYARSEASRLSTSDADQDLDFSDIHQGGSGLYKVLQADGKVRWSCGKSHSLSSQSLRTAHDPHTRTADLSAANRDQFDVRVIAISKLKSLFRIDITLNWDIEKGHFADLMMTLQREATTVSAIAIRLHKNAAPLAWRRDLQSQDGNDQQPMSEVISLFKSRRIRHVILEGDIDLMTVPNIGNMDLSNLDILSIMKSSNRGYQHRGSPTDSNFDTVEGVNNVSASLRTYSQETYIPQLVSFLNCCSLLTELALGFPDAVPGHIRILDACMTSLTRLQRLDLYRVLSTSTTGNRNNAPTSINRKLELSASLSASKIVRLYLADCKTTSDGRTKLLESLEELLMDAGPSLEDLELRYVGFNDKHAHALEVGTKPFAGRHACRLRRLVIHGKGLEFGGVSALKRVLRRATKPMRQNSALSQNRSANGSRAGGPSTESIVAMAATESPTPEDLETLSFGIMLDQATLLHLELCSIDSLSDSDWASLLSELSPKRLLTLDLQGARFGDRAMAMLAWNTGDEMDEFAFAPSLTPSSSFAPLPLQTFRLSCPTLSHKGVVPLREFLSRLTRLSTLSLHGFRAVTAEQWVDIMARIAFQWIEVIEVMSPGYDDECTQYLGDRIEARRQAPFTETPSSADSSRAPVAEPALPLYSARSPAAASSNDSIAGTTITSSELTSGTRFGRRDSISSRLFGSKATSSLAPNGRKRSLEKGSLDNGLKNAPTLVLQTSSTSHPSPSQKYLEIDLRYTDVSAKGLSLLRSQMGGQAKKVIVRGDDEDGDSGERTNFEDQVELKKLAAKLREERVSEDVSSRTGGNGRRGSQTLAKSFVTVSSSSALFAYHTSSVAMAPEQQQPPSSKSGSGGSAPRKANLSSSSAKLSKLKTFFLKK